MRKPLDYTGRIPRVNDKVIFEGREFGLVLQEKDGFYLLRIDNKTGTYFEVCELNQIKFYV